jgi:tetratricopeptide (TPR) repeat protein
VALLLGVSFLCVAPWVLLLHLESRSIDRFVAVAADFPDFQRGYAYEEVGKYYRKADDIAKAEKLYELAVQANPSHARLRVLMGAIYYSQAKYDQASEQYTAAYQIDPKNYMAMEMLGKVALQKKEYGAALDWFRRLLEVRPNEAASWELYGYTALRNDQSEEAIRGLSKAMAMDPKLDYRQEVGVALVKLQRYEEAIRTFRAILASSTDLRPETHLALAFTRIAQIQDGITNGVPVPAAWVEEAEAEIRAVQAARPGDPQAADLLGKLRHLTR